MCSITHSLSPGHPTTFHNVDIMEGVDQGKDLDQPQHSEHRMRVTMTPSNSNQLTLYCQWLLCSMCPSRQGQLFGLHLQDSHIQLHKVPFIIPPASKKELDIGIRQGLIYPPLPLLPESRHQKLKLKTRSIQHRVTLGYKHKESREASLYRV